MRAKAADLEEDELSESDDEELRKELEADAALDDEDEEDDVSILRYSIRNLPVARELVNMLRCLRRRPLVSRFLLMCAFLEEAFSRL